MLISRAIMPMLTAVNVQPLVYEVVSQLNLKRQNQLHGLLLIVERMIANHSKFLRLDCDEHSSVAHLLLHMLLDKQVISSEYVALSVCNVFIAATKMCSFVRSNSRILVNKNLTVCGGYVPLLGIPHWGHNHMLPSWYKPQLICDSHIWHLYKG